MQITVNINLPFLWKEQVLQKNEWGPITYVVGPNGTGKTQFAEQLKNQFKNSGLNVRYLSAERMAGLERQSYSYFTNNSLDRGLNIGDFNQYKHFGTEYGLMADSWIIIKNKLDVRVRIEAVLSQMFNRQIRLSEQGGFLMPRIQRYGYNEEYGLKDKECHGLKELIGLLAFLYDDEYNCLIFDEPELHLHPQYQQFIMAEIKKMAGDPQIQPDKKCFVIITHSPYMLDIRTVDDLYNLIVFQPGHIPAWISQLEQEDLYRIQKMLPRLNTHHKQFFFASRPIFVEGYTDQQFLSLLQEAREQNLGAGGISIIDVGGKEEVDAFYRLCEKFNIRAYALVDYDALFEGKIRQTVSQKPPVQEYVQKEGLGTDLISVIGEMIRHINEIMPEIEALQECQLGDDHELKQFLKAFQQNTDDRIRRRITYMVIKRKQNELMQLIPGKAPNISIVAGRAAKIEKAFAQAGVFVLPKGELENYYPSYTGNPYSIPDNEKTNVFLAERDFILSNHNKFIIEERYKVLITILDMACGILSIDVTKFLNATIGDWIHAVQTSVALGEIRDLDSLKANPRVQWAVYERIIDVKSFDINDKMEFSCTIAMRPTVDVKERITTFDDKTVPAKFCLPT
ncbi:MAG: AAA family ATPase [Clostridiales bacterium]|nr:AAA family ATPase [Eubacteriales bacterium]MDH7566823.1 AAA family ATPase [Clostridiales bacterium]